MPDTKLTREQQVHVVMRLACYDTPTAIAQSLREQFGVEITRQSIEFYDPTKLAGKRCPKPWSDLFQATRAKLIDGTADIGAAHRLVRIERRARMAERAEQKEQFAAANALYNSIAREVGGGFTNRRESGGRGANPAQVRSIYDYSDDELRAIVAQGLDQALAPARSAEKPDRVHRRDRNPRKPIGRSPDEA
jgi:hypothetical protein